MTPSPPEPGCERRSRWPVWLALGAVAAGVPLGFELVRFWTDDAFIAFRYASNAMLGRGLVWNPAPFAPVEGYSSFLWVVLLWSIWAASGVEPPQAVQPLGLLCGFGQLWICWTWIARMELAPRWRAARCWLAVAVLALVASNRTFLTWLSSGLETPLFNLCLLWWLLLASAPAERRTRRWLLWLATSATLTALARPEGLLAVAATAWVALHSARAGRIGPPRRIALACLPLLGTAMHLLWRRCYYGEWLPNTFHAKTVAVWPGAGLRYLASFAVEHGTLVWAPVLAAGIAVAWRRSGRLLDAPGRAAVAVLAVHGAYYVLVMGGDLFEYRAFSHLVALQCVSFVWAVTHCFAAPGPLPLCALALFAVSANTPGWLLFPPDRQHPGRFVRLADRLPEALGPLAHAFDRNQAWLHLRWICVRSPLLDRSARDILDLLPSRAEGERMSFDDRPVLAAGGVGAAGWTLPNVAILDLHGLNDWVVARTPVAPVGTAVDPVALREIFARADTDGDGRLAGAEIDRCLCEHQPHLAARPEVRANLLELLLLLHDRDTDGAWNGDEFAAVPQSLLPLRRIAHERQPPAGYVAAFRPNVELRQRRAHVAPRTPPLRDADIVGAELRFRSLVSGGAR